MGITYVHNYYDAVRGWEHTNPYWYQVDVETKSSEHHLEMVKWLYDNIDNPERHARWIYLLTLEMNSHFRFRYERDCIWFKLTWQ